MHFKILNTKVTKNPNSYKEMHITINIDFTKHTVETIIIIVPLSLFHSMHFSFDHADDDEH